MNSDLTVPRTRTTTIAILPILGRTLSRGPTNILCTHQMPLKENIVVGAMGKKHPHERDSNVSRANLV